MKRTLIVLLVAGLAIGCLIVSHRRAASRAEMQAKWERLKAERAAELERIRQQAPRSFRPMLVHPIPKESATKSKANSASNLTDAGLAQSTNRVGNGTQSISVTAPRVVASGSKKGALQDPLAREALAFVGGDPEAEAVWVDAINNPELPAKERQDLIEDLNEEGFADPKHLTPDDLPLILSRLELIERYAPAAMDEVNLAAFMEAYKDLVNMAAGLME